MDILELNNNNLEMLYNNLSEAGNLPEDEEIYNEIEELEKIIKDLEC